MKDTQEVSVFDPPIAGIALLCSLLLGFGDACINTQIYTMLAGAFASNSVAAFAVFKFTQVSAIEERYHEAKQILATLQNLCRTSSFGFHLPFFKMEQTQQKKKHSI